MAIRDPMTTIAIGCYDDMWVRVVMMMVMMMVMIWWW